MPKNSSASTSDSTISGANDRACANARVTLCGSASVRGSAEWIVPNTHDVYAPARSTRNSNPRENGASARAANGMSAAAIASPSATIMRIASAPGWQCEQTLTVAVRDHRRGRRRKLREPAPVIIDDLAVLRPSRIDPRVRADDEAVGEAFEQRAPLGCETAVGRDVVAVRKLTDEVRVLREVAGDRRRRRREARVRPDDANARIVGEQQPERRFVAVRVQPQAPLYGEHDDAAQPRRVRVAPEYVEFADAAPRDRPRELRLDQGVDRRVVEPRLPIRFGAIGPNEWDDAKRRRLRIRGGDERARAVVRATRRENRVHAARVQLAQHGRDRQCGGRLVVVMEVRIEDRQSIVGAHRQPDAQRDERRDGGSRSGDSHPRAAPATWLANAIPAHRGECRTASSVRTRRLVRRDGVDSAL